MFKVIQWLEYTVLIGMNTGEQYVTHSLATAERIGQSTLTNESSVR